MKVGIVTLTRDRLEYTRRSFAALRANAGYPYRHYVFDNGSADGTADWLEKHRGDFAKLTLWPLNDGIGPGWIAGARAAIADGCDLIIKADNDSALVQPGTLAELVRIYEHRPSFVLSPRVVGINRQPRRAGTEEIAGHVVGITGMVGGLFLCAHAALYVGYEFPSNLPKAQGYDSAFCSYARYLGWRTGYVEDLVVEHIDGTDEQARKFPDYFARKRIEEVEP